MDEVVFRDGADHMIQVVVKPDGMQFVAGIMYGGQGDRFLDVWRGTKDLCVGYAMRLADAFVTERNIFVLEDGVEVFATFYLKEIIMEPAADVPEAVKAAMAAQKGVH